MRRPRPLVLLDGLERPPDDLLRRLRHLDARLDLVGVGQGIWWLLRYVDTRERRRRAGTILGQSLVLEKNRWIRLQAKLAYRGFGFISDWQGTPDTRILLDFQRREWERRQTSLEAQFAAMLAHSDGTTRYQHNLAILQDRLASEGPSIFRHVTRRPVSFSFGRRSA